MNQDDFRRLLNSGGGGSGGRKHGGASSGNLHGPDMDADSIRKLSAKKHSKKKGGKPHKGRGEDDGGDTSGAAPKGSASMYRDRAAERRLGLGKDMVDADEFKHLDAEQTKFLGGDMAHTHLVKGLDLSLLAQLKREKQKLVQATAAERLKHGPAGEQSSTTTDTADAEREPTFQTRMGRMVYFHASQNRPLADGAKLVKSETFLPGRMYYAFKVSSDDFESIPVAIQRSKEDCPELDDIVSGLVDDLAISEVQRVLGEKKAGKKMRRKRADAAVEDEKRDDTGVTGPVDDADAAESKVIVDEDDDDFDIFPDAGDYVPAYLREDETTGDKKCAEEDAAASAESRGYFSNLSASITEAERKARRKEQEAEDAWKATLQKASTAQAKVEEEGAMRARAAKLAAAQDSYSEYLPGGGADDSDDDDEQPGKKRKGDDAKKNGPATEIDGEEKNRRKKQKQGNKLENDLKKINKIMESKS